MIWRDTFKTPYELRIWENFHYFVGIEVAQSKEDINLTQRNYVLYIFKEIGLLESKPVVTLMDPNVKLYED